MKILTATSIANRCVAPIETLPNEIVSQICDELDESDQPHQTFPRQRLHHQIAFALTCKAFAKGYHYRARTQTRTITNILRLNLERIHGLGQRYCYQCDRFRATDQEYWERVMVSFFEESKGEAGLDFAVVEAQNWVNAWCGGSVWYTGPRPEWCRLPVCCPGHWLNQLLAYAKYKSENGFWEACRRRYKQQK
jgi:hypothetical protein